MELNIYLKKKLKFEVNPLIFCSSSEKSRCAFFAEKCRTLYKQHYPISSIRKENSNKILFGTSWPLTRTCDLCVCLTMWVTAGFGISDQVWLEIEHG